MKTLFITTPFPARPPSKKRRPSPSSTASPLPVLPTPPTSPKPLKSVSRPSPQPFPYLYGTCHYLGPVTLTTASGSVRFQPQKVTSSVFEQTHIQAREVATFENDAPATTLKSVRILGRPDAPSSLLILLERTTTGWRFLQPSAEFPRL